MLKREGTLEIPAAVVGVFTAIFDPAISVVRAVVALAELGASHLPKKA